MKVAPADCGTGLTIFDPNRSSSSCGCWEAVCCGVVVVCIEAKRSAIKSTGLAWLGAGCELNRSFIRSIPVLCGAFPVLNKFYFHIKSATTQRNTCKVLPQHLKEQEKKRLITLHSSFVSIWVCLLWPAFCLELVFARFRFVMKVR